MIGFILILLVSLFFFIIVPLFFKMKNQRINSFYIDKIINSSDSEILEYKNSCDVKNFDKCYRFYGRVEGFYDDNTLWVKSDSLTVKVNMLSSNILVLPEKIKSNIDKSYLKNQGGQFRFEKWENTHLISSGVKFCIIGQPYLENGEIVFDCSNRDSIIILYGGDKDKVELQAIEQVRDKFFFNSGPFLFMLFFGLIFDAFLYVLFFRFKIGSIWGLYSLLLIFWPFAIFLPPGVLFLHFARIFFYKKNILLFRKNYRRFKKLKDEKDFLNLNKTILLYYLFIFFFAILGFFLNYIVLFLLFYSLF